ncbi:MAG TPA: diaminopimelate epimerase [Rhabdochlamydiaceae bacterium]|nr:diaminopimelate epimerase [Rhabdochlamydiaceae bacterium]
MLPFSKYHSSGNDLILIEDFKKSFPSDDHSLIRRICHRKFGIGSDGLVLLQINGKEFAMRFFNPDGAEATACGNALLCLGYFIRSLGHYHSSYEIETVSGKRMIRFDENKVIASLGIPKRLYWDLVVEEQRCFVVDTGVPHAIVLGSPSDFQESSRKIRYHPQFAPGGVNVNWVESAQDKVVKIRTYERGVEGETLACGTGAAAAAVVMAQLHGWQGKLEMVFGSGEKIDVYLSSAVEIAGEPKFVFKGLYSL